MVKQPLNWHKNRGCLVKNNIAGKEIFMIAAKFMCKTVRNEVEVLKDFAKGDKAVTESLDNAAKGVVSYLMTKSITLSTAESCTGGLVSEAVTSVAGASKIYLGGVCSYTEQMKMLVLGVKEKTLKEHTVYSPQVASEMSLGVMRLTGSDASIGITGLAGPDGGTEEKPVGTVYVSVRFGETETVKDLALYREYENPDRRKIRMLTAVKALEMLKSLIVSSESEDE